MQFHIYKYLTKIKIVESAKLNQKEEREVEKHTKKPLQLFLKYQFLMILILFSFTN